MRPVTVAVLATLFGALAIPSASGAESAPESLTRPTISGSLTEGALLTAAPGTWSGASPISFSYQWLRCRGDCYTIAGATGPIYQLVDADVNRELRVRVTATNAYGSDSARSSRTRAVRAGTSTPDPTPPPGPGQAPGEPDPTPPSGQSVVVTDRSWTCSGPVNLDLVKVTIRAGASANNAVFLKSGCTGRIGRIEIDQWREDGIKVHGGSHDLVIGGGYIACHARAGSVHQDGIQVHAGARIVFQNLRIDCPTSPNAALFFSAGEHMPTDVVCDGCYLLPANSTVNIKVSLRSGIRNSVVCQGRAGQAIRIQDGAVQPVNQSNTLLARGDPRCTSGA
ncbi:MAG: hypothetical protein IT201_04910 [Thermoleophilia bacterium]|nr:hypothetical protein [Thermoleophilia bacterium]